MVLLLKWTILYIIKHSIQKNNAKPRNPSGAESPQESDLAFSDAFDSSFRVHIAYWFNFSSSNY